MHQRATRAEQVSGQPDRGWPTALTYPLLAAALNHIHTDPARRWTVRDLGAEIGLSKQLSRTSSPPWWDSRPWRI
ncbi:hypothetical protein [Nocardia amamiensis]|uniref:hypothetical protein n=1 Tax=Nocardia amamiensis TaxID=404578 RepID=UPI000834FC96|nr:hypothetical protein [Nocardia amamiensis]